ncbi:MAG: lactate utilization protein C [Sphingomonadales bacterium]
MAGDSRAQILGRLRRAVPRHAAAQARPPSDRIGPATSAEDNRARFVERLEAARSTVDRLSSLAEVPAAVARYLAGQNLPARLYVAPELRDRLDFGTVSVSVSDSLPVDDGWAVLTGCAAAVSETGTFVAASGPDRDQRLTYLAETLIVVVGANQILGAYEEVWDRLGVRAGHGAPRLVSFITGPSRTADIEQTIEWGAHGPRRLHVLISDEMP